MSENAGNVYVKQKHAPEFVSSRSHAQFESADALGRGMTTTVERKAQLWHSRRQLGANTGSAESRTTGIGMSANRAES